jgi:hypothetical protein
MELDIEIWAEMKIPARYLVRHNRRADRESSERKRKKDKVYHLANRGVVPVSGAGMLESPA